MIGRADIEGSKSNILMAKLKKFELKFTILLVVTYRTAQKFDGAKF